MKIVIFGELIDTKEITDISEVEKGKRYFLNRQAGFIIKFMNGTTKVFSEKIPYESTYNDIHAIKSKWGKLQNEITEQWKKDKHGLQEFGF